jgi:hypothetical protein
MSSFFWFHYALRIGAAGAAIVAITWIRINDSRRERRRLQRLGDCIEND